MAYHLVHTSRRLRTQWLFSLSYRPRTAIGPNLWSLMGLAKPAAGRAGWCRRLARSYWSLALSNVSADPEKERLRFTAGYCHSDRPPFSAYQYR